MYKLIVSDLDGTLLDDSHKISNYTKKIVSNIQDKDIKFLIASARPHISALKYYKILNLNTPLISHNGGLVKLKNDKTIYKKIIPETLTQDILNYLKKSDIHFSLYYEDSIYVKKLTPEAKELHLELESIQPIEVGNSIYNLEKSPINIILSVPEKLVTKTVTVLEDKFKRKLAIKQSEKKFISISSLQATKELALKKILDYYKINKDNIIAIGDNYNDLGMLNFAGYSLAMKNSPKELQKISDDIAGNNNKSGVAKKLANLLFTE